MNRLRLVLSFTLFLGTWSAAWSAPPKPNILFILTDDQGWPTLSCYGNMRVKTPHLDRLAAEGVRFTDAYVTPQCTPTRVALFTGQHPARNGMWHVIVGSHYPWAKVQEPTYGRNLSREAFTLAKGLKRAGYTTACLGKWHVTANADGHYNGLKAAAAAHYGFDVAVPAGPKDPDAGDRHVNYLTDEAIQFIDKNRSNPWFCYVAHHAVHADVAAPATLVDKYRKHGAPATGLHNATYLASLEHIDNSVGRLLAKLDEFKLRERTVVVFLSDNGGVHWRYDTKPFVEGPGSAKQLTVKDKAFDNAPLRAGKGSPYEGGIRVPCIVRWPGKAKTGLVAHTPIQICDWLPTLFELAGAKAPGGYRLDGQSLTEVLAGGKLKERALYWYMPLYDLNWGATPCAVIRRGDLKLIEFFGDSFDAQGRYVPGNKVELYDLAKDIGESNDLSKQNLAMGKDLRDQLRGWLQSVPAEVPGDNPQYDEKRALKEVKSN